LLSHIDFFEIQRITLGISSPGKTPLTVKSSSEFRISKGKEWKAMVSKKQVDKEVEVQIMIGA